MKMRRSSWIEPGHDGGQLEVTVVIGVEVATVVKGWAGIVVVTIHVGMPHIDPAIWNRLALGIEHAAPNDQNRTIAAGDEVVVDGAYELKLASTAKPSAEGHFHADGTFHKEKD